MSTPWKYTAILSLALLAFSCEKEKSGLIDPSQNLPFVAASAVTPLELNLDALAGNGDSLANGKYRLRISVHGTALPSGGPAIAQVFYRLTQSGASSSFQTGTVATTQSHDSVLFNDQISFTAGRNDIGTYLLDVWSKNAAGNAGNTVQLSFSVKRRDKRPYLFNPVAPDTIVRPTSGITVVYFAVSAADSDGYDDLQLVTVKKISPNIKGPFTLLDDGNFNADGDQSAGDGVFTIAFKIDETATLGDQLYFFQAIDKSGIASDSVYHRVTIIQ